MRARPTLRYPILYLALVPLASLMLESVFLQPQAVALGVPIAGIGVIVMAVQLTTMAGSTWSDRVTARLGEGRVLYTAPMVICSSLILLAALQVLPALLLIAVMGFLHAHDDRRAVFLAGVIYHAPEGASFVLGAVADAVARRARSARF